jgi:hypothetical protein
MRLLTVLVVLIAASIPPASASGRAASPPDRTEVLAALEVLHGWDSRRASAWARADEQALRSLYEPGSGAGRSDVRLLRSYTARGFVVRRMVTQVFGVKVLRRDPDRLTVLVRDRVAGGEVEQGHRRVALPSSPPVVRRIEFRRVASVWKVDAVTR